MIVHYTSTHGHMLMFNLACMVKVTITHIMLNLILAVNELVSSTPVTSVSSYSVHVGSLIVSDRSAGMYSTPLIWGLTSLQDGES